jgi:flagellar protein FlaG
MSTSQIAALGKSVPASPAPVAVGRSEAVRPVAQAAVESSSRKVDPAELEKAVATLNKFVQATAQEVNFVIDKDTKQVVVKVMDTASNKVLQQFPSEDALAMTKALDKLNGILLGKVQA